MRRMREAETTRLLWCGEHPFVAEDEVARTGAKTGPLSGLRFAVKDMFEIRGHRASAGNPTWYATHAPAERDAPVVSQCLRAGASLCGVTVLDELALSIEGVNVHLGTPRNPRAPGRACGGSSSGSASAVALGLCDFALGTDTGGSIRVPASYCGLFGIRPTHDRLPLEGLSRLAPSFDCIGWLAGSGSLLSRVGEVLLRTAIPSDVPTTRLLLPREAWALVEAQARAPLSAAVDAAAKALGATVEEIDLAPEGLERWHLAFMRTQRREAWGELGAWIERAKPSFGPGVKERFESCRALAESAEGVDEDRALRESVRERLARVLDPPGSALCVPSTPDVAPTLESSAAERLRVRTTTMTVTCIAGLAGLPEVSLPLARAGGLPLGVGFVAAHQRDELLLALAARVDVAGLATL